MDLMSDKINLITNENNIKELDLYFERKPSFWCKCLKRLATPEIFLINFSIVSIIQGSIFTYMIGSLSTLEKRYSFDSKVSGFILIADHLSQIILSPLVGYLGNKYNRPRIMAIGQMIAGVSCFLFAAPYFIYGSVEHQLISNIRQLSNFSTYELCQTYQLDDDCHSNTVWSAVVIFLMASFLNGIGCIAYYAIGIPYIDDNTSKINSPIFLSACSAVRLLGPAVGLLLSAHFLEQNENPDIKVDIPMNDPRWIGCWWMGFIIIGIFLVIFSIPLTLFPTQMSDKGNKPKDPKQLKSFETISTVTDICLKLKRLLTNPIYVFHVLAIIFKLFGYLGYYIFKPKYIESQFRKSASDANFWTGVIVIPTMVIGMISSGIIISRFRPRARTIALYLFIAQAVIAISVLYCRTLQCPPLIFPQTQLIDDNYHMTSTCNTNCHCTTKSFQPVCSSNGKYNYFSPCFAGCTEQLPSDKSNKKTFANCKCDQFGYGQVSDGYCPTDCNQFTSYVTVFAIVGIIASTAKTSDTLLALRCVDPEDKNFAIGLSGAFVAIFAFIPYPIVFGAITDSACKIWKHTCGKTGNCWLYDIEKLTNHLHYTSFGFMFVGVVCHLMVVLYADRITNMFEEDDNENQPCDSSTDALIEYKNDDHIE
ncbi:solute carrier organic anion transporter family member 74D-like [Oppia nitens]|uniref:solute carrier organic anion transporter family member 74D-like n=1 Tax=Oppia nitens TaxID=1686743 RepID=UPI0023DA245B|nr:solute carrier organic anion transporter family member 74D-like [Oppia nitens]